MTTYCTFCKREINEDSPINKGKKYLLCKCGHGFVPRGANNKNKENEDITKQKEVITKMAEEKKEKKKRNTGEHDNKILALFASGKKAQEIAKELHLAPGYIRFRLRQNNLSSRKKKEC